MMRTLFSLGLSLMVVARVAEAAVLRVPSEYPTIQAGIDASADGDAVLVAPGVYSGDGNVSMGIWKSITVMSDAGPLQCVVDCQGTFDEPSGGFVATHGAARSVVAIEGFTVRNAYGSAFLCWSNCELKINNCVIVNNTAYRGAAIRVNGDDETDVTLTNCLLTGNQCAGERAIGGGVFCENGTTWYGSGPRVVLRNCLIAGNRATFGGGVACKEGTVRLENCIVTDNRALTGKGGDLYLGNSNAGCSIVGCQVGFIELVHSCFDEEVPTISWDYEGSWGSPGWLIDFHGQGNIAADPLFATPGYWDPNGTEDDPNDDLWVDGDYYLQSQAGRWDPDSDAWVRDDVTSPCIDAGDPNSLIMYEPFPNGGIVNIGAYGGTAEASKSYFGTEPSTTIITGDIDGDGRVSFKDLELLISHWLWQGEHELEPIPQEVYHPEEPDNDDDSPDRPTR